MARQDGEEDSYQYYTQDEQKSIMYLLDEQQEINNAYRYDAFGNLLEKEEESINRLLYTGQMYDEAMGQYYLRARYYSPMIGRFLQEDVYRGDGLNLYAYCGNHPVRYYDPSGYMSICPDLPDSRNADPRYQAGNVTGSEALYDVNEMMRGSNGNIGIIPKEIGDKLQGKTFKNFDEFREELWKEIGNSKYANAFNKGNRTLMKDGKAPFAVPEQWNGMVGRYAIHHKIPIHDGGGVYDLSNLVIVTPRMHLDILDRSYHFNK